MGYRNRVMHLDFEDLGDGCYVVIRNPRVLPLKAIEPDAELATDANGRPTDRIAADKAVKDMLAKLIVEWKMWDANDESDDPPVLPLPKDDPTSMDKVPTAVWTKLNEVITEAMNPQ